MDFKKEISYILNDFVDAIKLVELNDKTKFNIYADMINHIYLQFNETTPDLETVIKEIILNYRKVLSAVDIDHNKHEYNNEQITKLKKLKQPVQRSKEWHDYRNNRLTASDLGTAMNINPYSKRKKLIAKKCGYNEPFFEGPAIKHGVKYEDVAVHIYEKRNDVSVFEYGCIPHPTIPHFGASPDGICDVNSKNKNYIGRMLEIKCPKSRVIDEFIPPHYELQVQGQLEVCGLDYCDYLECSIKEYDSFEIFLEDSDTNDHSKRKNGYEKGVLIEGYSPEKDKTIYFYLYDTTKKEEIIEWEKKTIQELGDISYNKTTYWYLEEYSVKLIHRDKSRFDNELKPEIDRFWEDVLHYRKTGYSSLVYNKKELNFLPDSP